MWIHGIVGMLVSARIGPSVNEVRLTIRCLLPEGHPTLQAVAVELHISTRSLQRQLASAGLTYSELVRDVRQERACQLLQQPKISIKQVALRTGFASPSGFSRAFHAWTGLSPRDYRRNPDPA